MFSMSTFDLSFNYGRISHLRDRNLVSVCIEKEGNRVFAIPLSAVVVAVLGSYTLAS